MFNLLNTLNVYILNPLALERSFKVVANLLGELSTNIEMENVLLTELTWLPEDIHVKILGTLQNANLDMREFLRIDKTYTGKTCIGKIGK